MSDMSFRRRYRAACRSDSDTDFHTPYPTYRRRESFQTDESPRIRNRAKARPSCGDTIRLILTAFAKNN